MDKKIVYLIFVVVFIVGAFMVSGINSSNYESDMVVANGGGDSVSSSYNSSAVVGMISGDIVSSSYDNHVGFYSGVAAFPLMVSSRIFSSTNSSLFDLLGYCKATYSDGDLVYYYQWYKNDVENLNGKTSGSYSSGVEVNVHNVTFGNLTEGDEWTLGCLANSGVVNSTWLNSSVLTINDAPRIEFVSPPTPADDSTTSDTSILINTSIEELNLDEVVFDWNGTNTTLFNDSLVLMMNFDNVSALGESSTNVVDVSGYGNNGTWTGGQDADSGWTTDGKYNGGMMFDGAGDYVDVGDVDSLNFINNFSFVSWVYPTVSNPYATIIGKRDSSHSQYQFRISNMKINYLDYDYTAFNGDSLLELNHWYCVAMTFKDGQLKFYLNGLEDGSFSGVDSSFVDINTFIGAREAGNYFFGSIDEVRIFNRSLSADEIQQLYFSNLRKFDYNKWELVINQSKNATDGLDAGVYSYEAYAGDEYGLWNSTGERSVRVNTPPTVTLSYPLDEADMIDRSPLFNWTSYDADGDSLTYEIEIQDQGGTSFCSDYINVDDLGSEEYASGDLDCLSDYNYYYRWRVRAHDGVVWGDWTGYRTFNVSAYLSVSLPVNSTSFGDLNPLFSNDTSDNNPAPFVISNDGNVLTNISLNSTQFWDTESSNSSYYRAKVDNKSGFSMAFEWLSSITSWFNVPINGNTVFIDRLNYTTGGDQAEIDMYVEVPPSESAGSKSASIILTAELAEYDS